MSKKIDSIKCKLEVHTQPPFGKVYILNCFRPFPYREYSGGVVNSWFLDDRKTLLLLCALKCHIVVHCSAVQCSAVQCSAVLQCDSRRDTCLQMSSAVKVHWLHCFALQLAAIAALHCSSHILQHWAIFLTRYCTAVGALQCNCWSTTLVSGPPVWTTQHCGRAVVTLLCTDALQD